MSKLYKKFNNSSFIYILIIFLITLGIFWRPLTTNGLMYHTDAGSSIMNMSVLDNLSNYIYVEKYLNYIKNPLYITLFFILQKIYYPISIFASPEIWSAVRVILPYLCLNLSAYLSLYLLVKDRQISFLQTLLFIFNIYYFSTLFHGSISLIWSISGGLVMFCTVVKYLEEPKYKYLVFASLSSLFGTMNLAFFYCAVVATVLYTIIFLLRTGISLKNLFIKYRGLVWLLVLGVLLNCFWLFPYLLSFTKYGIEYGNTNHILFTRYIGFTKPLNNFYFGQVYQYHPLYSQNFHLYNSIWYRFLTTSFLLDLFFLSVFKKHKDSSILSLLLLFLLMFSFTLGTDFILWDTLTYIPGWFFLRNVTRFYYLLLFVQVLILGKILVGGVSKIQIFFFIFYVSVNILVFFRGDVYKLFTKIELPQDYNQIVNYLSTSPRQNQTAVILPEVYNGNYYYKWINNKFVSLPLFDNILVNPIVEPYWGRGRIPEYFLPFFDDQIDKNSYAEYLGKAGIKFIIISYDLGDYYSHVPNIDNFDYAEGIVKIIDGPNVKLYEIDDYWYNPIIYSDNQVVYKKINPSKYLVKMRIDGESKLVFNRPFNDDIKLYLKRLNKDFVCNESYYLDDLGVRESQQENIFFQLDDITSLWKKDVFSNTHTQDYGYANKWLIKTDLIKNEFDKEYYYTNDDGSIELELILYFKPQSYFYLGIFISGIALIGCLVYLFTYRLRCKSDVLTLE